MTSHSLLLSGFVLVGTLLAGTRANAGAYSAVDTFSTQMGGRNVITSGDFSTNNHVHGTVAVGGATSLDGNAEINSHGSAGEGLVANGSLVLGGSNNRVMAGGATIVKNGTTNTDATVGSGVITTPQGSLTLQGNGGSSKTVTVLGSPDSSFAARDAQMQAANADLLGIAGAAGSLFENKRLTFSATTAGVSVFTWDVGTLKNISEVGFSFVDDSFIVVNIINSLGSDWNATFNLIAAGDFLASHVLWNLGVGLATLSGDQLLGSILAPDSVINSGKQLNGAIYAAELHQYDREIHYTPPAPPSQVPDAPSSTVAVIAAGSLGLAAIVRRRRTAKTAA